MGRSKKLQFSLLNAQDTVRISEFEVTHRDLYTAAERLPVKDGVLDRRLVRFTSYPILHVDGNKLYREQPTRMLYAKHAAGKLLNVWATMPMSNL